ncbi:hypothetical protein A2Z22_01975 [Candidatus Woesebacteria bacterium RBG_16_34_12]|uniref:Uncharacterized protein n=1 Tax=Candidatus Woesebacteria bacterium RBG_16_34_12 TaxID=1802480 RepID=A0A1F7XBH2_9BACT|nr:MAG: hypothetical protein A2Z22_01975 [Candidatus Woesebacteria bacterium RBG_16_34_12]
MSLKIKKSFVWGLLLILIFSFFFMNQIKIANGSEEYITIENSKWKYVIIKEGYYQNVKYPKYTIGYQSAPKYTNEQELTLNTPFETEAYIEKEFEIPPNGVSFSLGARTYSNHARGRIFLIDSKSSTHFLGEVTSHCEQFSPIGNCLQQYEYLNFDVSSYAGQKVKIRIDQISAPDGAGFGYYYEMKIKVKEYSIKDAFMDSDFRNIEILLSLFLMMIAILGILRGKMKRQKK